MIYAEVGYYLRHKNKQIVGMQLTGDEADYEELRLPEKLDVQADGNRVSWYGGLFSCVVGALNYEEVKKAVVKLRYTNDDQLAVMLNRDKADGERMYVRMQDWRTFATEIAREATGGA